MVRVSASLRLAVFVLAWFMGIELAADADALRNDCSSRQVWTVHH
jgi:hypothetical protein